MGGRRPGGEVEARQWGQTWWMWRRSASEDSRPATSLRRSAGREDQPAAAAAIKVKDVPSRERRVAPL